MKLAVFVPKNDCPFQSIARKSALVADTTKFFNGCLVVYFEGNLYKSENLETYEDRLLHAAGRLVKNYPTTAKAYFKWADLTQVGEYDTEAWRFSAFSHRLSELSEWLGEPRFLCPVELRKGEMVQVTSRFNADERRQRLVSIYRMAKANGYLVQEDRTWYLSIGYGSGRKLVHKPLLLLTDADIAQFTPSETIEMTAN